MILLKRQQPRVPHFAKLIGHGAAVHRQIVGKLLAVLFGNRKKRIPWQVITVSTDGKIL